MYFSGESSNPIRRREPMFPGRRSTVGELAMWGHPQMQAVQFDVAVKTLFEI
jgi:hypothetical protein